MKAAKTGKKIGKGKEKFHVCAFKMFYESYEAFDFLILFFSCFFLVLVEIEKSSFMKVCFINVLIKAEFFKGTRLCFVGTKLDCLV